MKAKAAALIILIVFLVGAGIGRYYLPAEAKPSSTMKTSQSTRNGLLPEDVKENSKLGQTFKTNPLCKDIDSYIKKYACWVDQAAAGINLEYSLTQKQISAFKTIVALNLVSNIASSSRYSFLKRQKHFVPPDNNSEESLLKNGYGICGNHQQLFVDILNMVGVSTRPVDFYYIDNNGRRQNHAAAEVKIGTEWRYVDVTYGTYWLKNGDDPSTMLGLDDVRRGKGIRFTNNNAWYMSSKINAGNPGWNSVFSYLHGDRLQILRNKGGEFSIRLEGGQANFSDVPNYVGTTVGGDPLSIELDGIFKPGNAVIDVEGVGGCKRSKLKVGNAEYPIVLGKTTVQIAPRTVISIAGDDDACYAIILALGLVSDFNNNGGI